MIEVLAVRAIAGRFEMSRVREIVFPVHIFCN